MKLHSAQTAETHLQIVENYKKRLSVLEHQDDKDEEENEAPFERSFLHNAIYLHTLWFEQLTATKEKSSSPLLEEILEQRESDLPTFEEWMNTFAHDAKPNGWAIWGWSYSLKTFVGFPIRSHDEKIPLGVAPILVIDCWEHSYTEDYGTSFDEYLQDFWAQLNWTVIETRHHELAGMLGYNIK